MATPTKLKALLGNPGKRELPKEPEFPKLESCPPAELPGRAKAEWIRLAPMLLETGIVTAADLSIFQDYCRSFAVCEELYESLESVGYVYVDKNGQERRNPKYLMLQAERAYLKDLRVQLGLTPIARRKLDGLTSVEKDDANPWSEDYEVR